MRWVVLALVASCGFPRPGDVVGAIDAPAEDTCCELLASEPALAKTGDTLTLEGTFDPAAMIMFPGGEMAPLAILGTHRATVVVPASATAGDLTMMFGGAVVGTTPFRRIVFDASLTTFAAKDWQASGARQDVSLAQLQSGATATTVGRYVYVIGGSNAGAARNTVERAAMFPDGTLGPFSVVAAVTLVTARSQHQALVIGGYLYVIGGTDGTSSLASIERAAIVAGELQPFEIVADLALATPRTQMSIAVIGNWLYVIGGMHEGQALDTIERASFRSDGSIGTFEAVADVTLLAARKGHTSVVTADALYVMAGSNGTALDTIERLPITPTGDLGASAAATPPNTLGPRDGAVGVQLADSYCLIGGKAAAIRRDVECAVIAPDGKLGAFALPASALTTDRTGAAAALVANNLFVLGGDATTSVVERAQINSGLLGAFTVAPPQTTAAVNPGGQTTTVVGDNVYVMGLDWFERARVPLDGTLGSFGDAPNVPNQSTYAQSTVVIGDGFYVIAGSRATGNVSRVERATINPDGSLGTFSIIGGLALTKPRQGFSSVVLGNNLYVIGGISGTTTQAFEGSVERATIMPSGSLSAFAVVPGVVFTPRTGAATVVIGSSLYMIGGRDGSGPRADVERVLISADGSLSTGVLGAAALPAGRAYPGLAVVGNALYVFGGQLAGGGTNTVLRAPIVSGVIGVFTQLPGHLTMARSGVNNVVLGNDLYVIGGTSGRTVEQAALQ